MKDLAKLKEQYAALGAEIERLEAKPAVNDGPLTEAPEMGAEYWVLYRDGYGKERWGSCNLDIATITGGLAFSTSEAAERYDRKRRAEQKLRTIIAKHAPDWRADWEDEKQKKARLYRHHRNKIWKYADNREAQTPGVIYFPPHLFATILSEMGDSLNDLL